jgi:hypothetical protein
MMPEEIARDVEERVKRSLEYSEKIYGEIAKEISGKDHILLLTTGWLKSPACGTQSALASLLGFSKSLHMDLSFFSRYIAPYHDNPTRDWEDVGLIIYDNPRDPWRGFFERLVRTLHILGFRGVVLSLGRGASYAKSLGEGFVVLDIPSGIDPILTYHIAVIRAILEIAGREKPMPRIAKLASEVSDPHSVIPDMVGRYGKRLEEIMDLIARETPVFIATCSSRSYAEGLIIDGVSISGLYDISEVSDIATLGSPAIVSYVEVERDLIPPSIMSSIISGRSLEIYLKTDPIVSPIYFRILSMISIAHRSRTIS